METIPSENRPVVKTSWKENIGWMGMVVTVGVLVQQVWSHYDSLAQYYVPKIFSGRFFEILGSADPLYTPLFKFVYVLEMVDTVFFLAAAVFALIQLIRRKMSIPKILSIYMLIAGAYNIVDHVLIYLLPPELEMVSMMYTLECLGFLVVDILLYLFYKKSKTFQALFFR